MVNLSIRLRELRKQAELTQKQLGERVGVSKAVISYYETSERTPSPEMLIRLAQTFHVTTDYLLGIEKTWHSIDVTGLSEEDVRTVQRVVEALRSKK